MNDSHIETLEQVRQFLAGMAVMIFLYQGPIYTPLILSAAVVVLTTNSPWLLAGGTGWAS